MSNEAPRRVQPKPEQLDIANATIANVNFHPEPDKPKKLNKYPSKPSTDNTAFIRLLTAFIAGGIVAVVAVASSLWLSQPRVVTMPGPTITVTVAPSPNISTSPSPSSSPKK